MKTYITYLLLLLPFLSFADEGKVYIRTSNSETAFDISSVAAIKQTAQGAITVEKTDGTTHPFADSKTLMLSFASTEAGVDFTEVNESALKIEGQWLSCGDYCKLKIVNSAGMEMQFKAEAKGIDISAYTPGVYVATCNEKSLKFAVK